MAIVEMNQTAQASKTQRIRLFDVLRGLSVVSMVGFHFCYDLVELQGYNLPWFRPPVEDIWRSSISWLFLALAGVMCSYSRNNFKRAAKYGLVALGIWIVTSLAAVDVPISFGIIYCMAASTLVYAMLQRFGIEPKGAAAAIVLFLIFCITLHISSGYLQIPGKLFDLPRTLYSTEYINWLGFPGPHFTSGDYYPLLPYCLMYLAGASLGPLLKQELPSKVKALGIYPLELIGRHALEIYILHQPILLLLSSLF